MAVWQGTTWSVIGKGKGMSWTHVEVGALHPEVLFNALDACTGESIPVEVVEDEEHKQSRHQTDVELEGGGE